jgi:hypothetical protein
MTPELNKTAEELLADAGGDLSKVAADLGIGQIPSDFHAINPFPLRYSRRQPPADLGRPEMRQYTISIRHADSPTWPVIDQTKIEAARAKYEAGTHEICQGRDRNFFSLYLIPRKVRCGARKFFQVY